LGDVFDFWFEYSSVIPKGFVRLLGKLAEFTDEGIKVYYFTGNHDMWMNNYFPTELNIPVFLDPAEFTIGSKKFMVGHGDGLGPGDKFYKFLKRIFRNRICQWCFARIHPNLGIGLAKYLAERSRQNHIKNELAFQGEDEWLFLHCKEREQISHHDFYVFGHRHLPLEMKINNTSTYYNVGEWIKEFTYGEFNGSDFYIRRFTE
jgi:UDP-2,3-diacylglucosamine hydrolase